MLKFVICFTSLLVTVLATGDLIILSHPKAISFKGHERIPQTTITEMYSAALGFTIQEPTNWSGFYISSPFKLPEAVVNVMIDGVSDIGSEFGYHFPVHTDTEESLAWDDLKSRVENRYPSGKSKLVRVELGELAGNAENVKFLGQKIKTEPQINLKYLKRNVEEDNTFLNELAVFNGIVHSVEEGIVKQDNTPDIYWFVLPGLHAVSDLHGSNSSVTNEAKQLLFDALIKLKDAFKMAYNGNVLVAAVTSDASHTRFSRSLKATGKTDKGAKNTEKDATLSSAADSDKDTSNLNLAPVYNPDYPVIFNIILWFSVVMFFSMLAICITIASMDPGRDSIIYRMTSNRMKKDN